MVGVTQAAQEADRVYEVLFDREFAGGLSARASGPRIYRLPLMSMINLSHGTRKDPAVYQVLRPTAVVHPVKSALGADAAANGNGEATPESFANAVAGGARNKRRPMQGQEGISSYENANRTPRVAQEDLPGAYPKNAPQPAIQKQQHAAANQRQKAPKQQAQKQQPKTKIELQRGDTLEKKQDQPKQPFTQQEKTVMKE